MTKELPIGFYQTEHASQADRLVEAVARAMFDDEYLSSATNSRNGEESAQDVLDRWWADADQPAPWHSRAAAVIAHATSDEAVERAAVAAYELRNGKGSWNLTALDIERINSRAMAKTAITAALAQLNALEG